MKTHLTTKTQCPLLWLCEHRAILPLTLVMLYFSDSLSSHSDPWEGWPEQTLPLDLKGPNQT